jgi:hypothetical protein
MRIAAYAPAIHRFAIRIPERVFPFTVVMLKQASC